LAPDIIIVGDPDRVGMIAKEFFDQVDVDTAHRGLHTVTGRVARTRQRVSLVTSGMGTGSLEIVLQEIVALHELDFATRKQRATHPTIHIIRVGTSGGLRTETQLGTSIIARYAVGLDNTGLFYDSPVTDSMCEKIEDQIRTALDFHAPVGRRFKGAIVPYVAKADDLVFSALMKCAGARHAPHLAGITTSNAGFFANQGRDVTRLDLTVPDIDLILSEMPPVGDNLHFENMEMESSFLFHFMNSLGHRAGAICPAIANRRNDTFASDIFGSVAQATTVALEALALLRKS
jgi:uridine phosphorylase